MEVIMSLPSDWLGPCGGMWQGDREGHTAGLIDSHWSTLQGGERKRDGGRWDREREVFS